MNPARRSSIQRPTFSLHGAGGTTSSPARPTLLRWLGSRTARTLALTLALGSRTARAQISLPTAEDADEAPLPDINAIERGAKSRASVSFGQPTLPTGAAMSAGPPDPAAGSGNETVRRLDVAPPPNPGGHAGIYGLDSAIAGLTAPDDGRPAQLPEQHVVKKGDTLTSVCEEYFSDPWCWPRLWAENPQVTNPHWIFPGDVLRLRSANSAALPTRPPTGLRLTSNRGPLEGTAVVLRETGFIDPQAFAESAHLTGSREEKIMLASGDQAYIGFQAAKPLHAGDRYSVFVADTEHPVRSPETGQLLGYLVRVYGDILVDQVAEGNVGRGTLLDLVDPVERGYAVSPRVHLFKQVEPKPASVNLEARVVASFSPSIMLAAENFVVLSRGSKDGLAVGNRIFVVRRGDGYRPIMEGWQKPDPSFPKEVVAELWVMDVGENAAVAWVARSTKELRVGEVAELRRGH